MGDFVVAIGVIGIVGYVLLTHFSRQQGVPQSHQTVSQSKHVLLPSPAKTLQHSYAGQIREADGDERPASFDSTARRQAFVVDRSPIKSEASTPVRYRGRGG